MIIFKFKERDYFYLEKEKESKKAPCGRRYKDIKVSYYEPKSDKDSHTLSL